MSDFARQRDRMVELQIARRGVRDPRTLAAMRETPRESFAPAELADLAYADSPLPIPCGQSISQPYVVALMIEAAELDSESRVLEVGAGTGYAAAVMGQIAARVYAIERHETLASSAAARMRRLGYDHIELRAGDGSLGWPEAAPFDAIVVSAGGPAAPEALLRQLKVGGRLVMPIGPTKGEQRLMKFTRTPDGFTQRDLGAVAFVPMIGAGGWSEASSDQP